jgi:glycosyltransferase involved in cell wall biosynthesis
MLPHGVLFVQPVGEKGGMEVNLLNEIRWLNREKFTPHVACLQDGPLASDLADVGASVHRFRRGRLRHAGRTLDTIIGLIGLIRSQRIDVVVCENALAHIYGRLAAIAARRPCILRSGGVGGPPDHVERLAFRLGAGCVIANSEFTRRSLAMAGVSYNRIVVVHRGVDLDLFSGRQHEGRVRASLGIPLEVPLVTTVGRLQRGKGQHVLLRAAKLVLNHCPDARFLIVGGALFGLEQEYPSELSALMTELGLRERVTLLGPRDDVPAILAASDIIVVPSVRPEGFGMATLEGMAAGKPVVATDIGATGELIRNEMTGLLVAPDSPRALADALLRLILEEALRRHLGAEARRVAEERFTIARAVRSYEGIYSKMIGAPNLAN